MARRKVRFPDLSFPASSILWLLAGVFLLILLACGTAAPPERAPQEEAPLETQAPIEPVTPAASPTPVPVEAPSDSPSSAPTTAPTAEPAGSPPATPMVPAPTPATAVNDATPTPLPTPSPMPTLVPATGGLVFTVAPDTEARYLVKEQFARRNFPNDAVGETSRVAGLVTVLGDGRVLPEESKLTIDVSTLRSDDDDRDDFLRDEALETDQFPLVEYVVEETSGLPWPIPEGQEFQFQLMGSMTAHGVTRPITWEMTAIMSGNQLVGQARTRFKFEEFEMEKPSVFFLLSVEDDIRLELDLVANISPDS